MNKELFKVAAKQLMQLSTFSNALYDAGLDVDMETIGYNDMCDALFASIDFDEVFPKASIEVDGSVYVADEIMEKLYQLVSSRKGYDEGELQKIYDLMETLKSKSKG